MTGEKPRIVVVREGPDGRLVADDEPNPRAMWCPWCSAPVDHTHRLHDAEGGRPDLAVTLCCTAGHKVIKGYVRAG